MLYLCRKCQTYQTSAEHVCVRRVDDLWAVDVRQGVLYLAETEAEPLHRRLAVLCRSDDCPCFERGFYRAQESVGEWHRPA